MGSGISERQFMTHMLNNHMPDYDFQVALLEKRRGMSNRSRVAFALITIT
jgi:hypothetical protein